MTTFVKLYQTILDSSVWSEPHSTRIVWITLLAMAGYDGRVEASLGGLARRAQVSKAEAERALAALLAPDPDDKSKVNEGRRIEVCPRGWVIVNHRHYRDLRTKKQAQTAERVRKFREKTRVTGNDVTRRNALKRQDTDTDQDTDPEEREEGELASLAPATPAVRARESHPKKSKRQKPARKPEVAMPTDWEPSSRHREQAATLGVDCDAQANAYRDHAEQHDRRLANWDAGFRIWLAKAPVFLAAQKQANGSSRHGRGPVQNHGVNVFAGARVIR